MSTKITKRYTAQYRSDAVKLANEIGASMAAKQLAIPVDTLYGWIARAKSGSLPLSPMPPTPGASLNLVEKFKTLEQEHKALKKEHAVLIKEHQILEGAVAFFATRQKK